MKLNIHKSGLIVLVRFGVMAAVFALLPSLFACSFEETELDPIPDDVLYYGKTQDGADAGGGSAPDSCEREEPSLDEFGSSEGALTGVWARKIVFASQTDTRENGDFKDSTTTVYELVELNHQGKKAREVIEVCSMEMVVLDGAQNEFPPSLINTLPILYQEGDFFAEKEAGKIEGGSYKNKEPLIRMWGLRPEAAKKEWGACKSYFDPDNLKEECPIALWPEIYDMDCDGQPGSTFMITLGSSPTEKLFSIRRTEIKFSGVVEKKDLIKGGVEFVENTAVLGTTKAMFKSNPPFKPINENSSFTMVKLQEGVTCADVKKELF